MAKKTARQQIVFECSVCKERNYYSEKNKNKTLERLELRKFCKRCQKHTLHKEGK